MSRSVEALRETSSLGKVDSGKAKVDIAENCVAAPLSAQERRSEWYSEQHLVRVIQSQPQFPPRSSVEESPAWSQEACERRALQCCYQQCQMPAAWAGMTQSRSQCANPDGKSKTVVVPPE